MILLFTDFGVGDPYIGQMHHRIQQLVPGAPVIDLLHAVPDYDIRHAAYLLPAYCPPMPETVYCCVVDPGVGGERSPVMIEIGGCHYVGPDNGLFELLVRRHPSATVQRIDWQPDALSDSFHGRDLFAPVSARLDAGKEVAGSPHTLDPGDPARWADDLYEVVYCDHYGNAITGVRASELGKDAVLVMGGQEIMYARTFSEMPERAVFWYINSNGLVEIAANRASACAQLGLVVGATFSLK